MHIGRHMDTHKNTQIGSKTDSSGGDLAPSLGGRKKFSRTKISEMTIFPEKCPFSRPKFLRTFFSHRPGFSDFPLFTVINKMSYTTLSTQEKPLFQKRIP